MSSPEPQRGRARRAPGRPGDRVFVRGARDADPVGAVDGRTTRGRDPRVAGPVRPGHPGADRPQFHTDTGENVTLSDTEWEDEPAPAGSPVDLDLLIETARRRLQALPNRAADAEIAAALDGAEPEAENAVPPLVWMPSFNSQWSLYWVYPADTHTGPSQRQHRREGPALYSPVGLPSRDRGRVVRRGRRRPGRWRSRRRPPCCGGRSGRAPSEGRRRRRPGGRVRPRRGSAPGRPCGRRRPSRTSPR